MAKKIADSGVEAKSTRLQGCTIALGICGSIGAVEVVKIIRELRRHGARVHAFCTPSVKDFISPLSIEWASGEKVSVAMGPEVDHLEEFDLVLIAPCTLNTLAKAAQGIADNAVTLLIAGQLGRRASLGLVPAMNAQLQNHPLYQQHLERLKSWGVMVYESPTEEGRLKVPEADSLAEWVIQRKK